MASRERVSIDVDVADGRTVIAVSGTRDAALMVESPGGESVYLPPEEEDLPEPSAAGGTTPYESAVSGAAPYEPSSDPYRPAGDELEDGPSGVETTPDGFRVVHPEPVTDFRVVRAGADG